MHFRAGPLRGEIQVPGDKSISHRALILGALSPQGISIENLNAGRDVRATITALSALGAQIEESGTQAFVRAASFHDPSDPLDCMNSGSTTRMLMGICSGANLRAQFTGDASLSRRPMEPVAAQLRAFGARIATNGGKLPLTVAGTNDPQTRRFILVNASAQIKTALLLAATFGATPIEIFGDRHSRDHTERLLAYFRADIDFDGKSIRLRAMPTDFKSVAVAGDFSAAAFFIVAALTTPGSRLTIRDVGVNPTRTGLLDALNQMGGNIELENLRERCGEPVADIRVEHRPLRGIVVGPELVIRAIDEVPALAVAAAFATGQTKISGIGELRTKESDRVAAIQRMLHAVGTTVEPLPNGISIIGGRPIADGSIIETQHDHRTAMSVAALAAGAGGLGIDSSAGMDVSFPDFLSVLQKVQT
ncbi:MAG: 3-phosphoshikimate 1-carboxyvinyltransferase [Candidatus Eremiobacteraeota bacterium]|nr:3-phosphoshikimate 1-carboxyvinyltransferase [Candidatus Eremiobacteraeota bacterium]